MNFVAAFILAAVVEAIIEFFCQRVRSKRKPYAAAFVAILLCCAYQADILVALGMLPIHPIVGYVVTGILIARGSNWINDFVSRLRLLGR